jgi:hypothetical protein
MCINNGLIYCKNSDEILMLNFIDKKVYHLENVAQSMATLMV